MTDLLTNTPQRYSFGHADEVLPLGNLLAIQLESFDWFMKEGLRQAFADISPIRDYSGKLELELEYDPNDPELRLDPKHSVEECKEKDMTYEEAIFVRARLRNRATEEIVQQTVFMGNMPKMTDKGTFIINGTERVIVSQLVRSPGVLFQPGKTGRTLITGTIHPYRGEWVEVDVDVKSNRELSAGARLARKRRMSLFVLLKALGFDDNEFLDKFVERYNFLSAQWEHEKNLYPTREDALLEVYKRIRPGESLSAEAAALYLENMFFSSVAKRYDLTKVGRYKLNKKLGPEIEKLEASFGITLDKPDVNQNVLSRSEILATASYMLNIVAREPGYHLDDQDHFANRRIRPVGELLQNQVKLGLSRLERQVREKMATQEPEGMTPNTLITQRPVIAAVREFFATSQLSQFMDQVNPLSSLAHKRRISALGPGGLSRERAGFEVRDVHTSHYGRMCPIETPEGPNIGLIGALATYAKVNEFGFVETPYRKVVDGQVTDEVVWLTADEEEKHVIAQATEPLDENKRFINSKVLARKGPQGPDLSLILGGSGVGTTSEVDLVNASEVDLMDVSPKQIVSVSTSMIPFVEHDDANRALMGANMQKQAVPLLVPEAPFIGTGVEKTTALNARELIFAEGNGVVKRVSADKIVVQYDAGQKIEGRALPTEVTYYLSKFRRSNQNTCINYKVRVSKNQRVKAGDILADGTAMDNGELALGKNLLVAFMPWEGYNYEDAIIISERLVRDDVLTSIHIEEHEVDARETKLGSEEITRDIPNLSEELLANLDERGIIRIGAEVEAGDILVGKVTPKGETELTPEERLLRAIFGEKARDVRDTSMKVPHGESGTVIDVRVYSRENGDELQAGVNEMVRVYVAQKRKIAEGDKLAGRHGNKGVIAKILPIEDMPYLADGTPVDIILNPLGVPSRMNVGQVLEAHLGYAAYFGWEPSVANAESKLKTRPRIEPATWVKCPAFDGAHWDEVEESRGKPTIKQVLERLNPDGIDGNKLIGPDGKAVLYNGRTGEPYDSRITVGYVYMMKLSHMVDDKIHARSTGPYSMITQQPLGGKAQFGGQRFGEMEVWALEAYGAAYGLQELLTIKSDDVLGRVKVYEAIVKGDNIPEPGIPESFKVLVKEIQSLGLNVEVLSASGEEVQLNELDEDIFKAQDDLGIDLSRPEKGSDEFDSGNIAGRRI